MQHARCGAACTFPACLRQKLLVRRQCEKNNTQAQAHAHGPNCFQPLPCPQQLLSLL